uniref:Uncharacterized protein n=1 Tax=Triticum urartu TaxID=4572 RepID=A0A8R7QYN8_TRIUA
MVFLVAELRSSWDIVTLYSVLICLVIASATQIFLGYCISAVWNRILSMACPILKYFVRELQCSKSTCNSVCAHPHRHWCRLLGCG